jgi:hypothetical protein
MSDFIKWGPRKLLHETRVSGLMSYAGAFQEKKCQIRGCFKLASVQIEAPWNGWKLCPEHLKQISKSPKAVGMKYNQI